VRYLLFDVFAEQPFSGNQLAVFPLDRAIPDVAMQRIANELNLAESVFLTKGDGERVAAQLRIFTPGREVQFAGHPTVGAAVAVADILRWIPQSTTEFFLNERIGDVAVRIERTAYTTAWLRTPEVTFGQVYSAQDGAAALSLAPVRISTATPVQIVSAGNPFAFVPLVDAAAVDDAVLDPAAAGKIAAGCVGVFLFARTAYGTYARMFAPMSGIAEDPATGSATGPAYAYLLKHGALPRISASYVSEQGTKMRRRSILHVEVVHAPAETWHVDVGGRAIHVGTGELDEAALLEAARQALSR